MSDKQQRGSRAQTLLRITRDAVDAAAIFKMPFARAVHARYLATTPESQRFIKPLAPMSDTDPKQFLKDEERVIMYIARFIDGAVNTWPMDIEDAWVECLPPPYRDQCEVALAERRDLLAAKLPAVEPREHIARLADVLRDAGAVAQACAPVFGNGSVNLRDVEHISRALPEIDRAMADLMGLRAQFATVVERTVETVMSPSGSV